MSTKKKNKNIIFQSSEENNLFHVYTNYSNDYWICISTNSYKSIYYFLKASYKLIYPCLSQTFWTEIAAIRNGFEGEG